MSYEATGQTFTAAELLERIRTRTILLETSVDWTNDRIIREVNDSIHSFISWAMSQAGGGRLVESYDRSATAALSSAYRAASEFELPPLCVGDTIEAVKWVAQDGLTENRLTLITENDEPVYDTPGSYGDPSYYSLLSGRIRIYPKPTSGGIVRFTYQRRHPELVDDTTTNMGTVVTAADAGGGYTLFTLTAASPFALGEYVDLVNGFFPYRPLFTSLYCGSSSACQLYVPFSYLSAVTPNGMRVVRSGQSPYVHVPLELRAALVEHASEKCLRSIGDMVGAGACAAAARDELSRVLNMLAPRTKYDRPKAVSWSSLARRSLRGGGFGNLR